MKNFSIFKRKASDNEKAPTHDISTKIGEDYVIVGACWTKDSKGGKFLSCKLQDAYADHTKGIKRQGFSLRADEEVETLENYSVENTDSPF